MIRIIKYEALRKKKSEHIFTQRFLVVLNAASLTLGKIISDLATSNVQWQEETAAWWLDSKSSTFPKFMQI